MKTAKKMLSIEFLQRLIVYILIILEMLLLLRIFLKATGANPNALFVLWVNNITYLPTLPFIGTFPDITVGASAQVELSTVFAMSIYSIAAFIVIVFLNILKTSPSKY